MATIITHVDEAALTAAVDAVFAPAAETAAATSSDSDDDDDEGEDVPYIPEKTDVTEFEFDAYNRPILKTVTHPDGSLTVTEYEYWSGTRRNYEIDDEGREAILKVSRKEAITTKYDKDGNKTKAIIDYGDWQEITEYTYDDEGRLEKEEVTARSRHAVVQILTVNPRHSASAGR